MSDNGQPESRPPELPVFRPRQAHPTGQELLYPAFMAGVCSGALSGVPLINICSCLWMLGGGMLAVYFFRLKNGWALPNPGDGARLGMLTGFFGFFLAFFINVFSQLLIHRGVQGFLARYREQVQRSPAASDPQSRELMAWALTPTGMAALFIAGTIVFFAFFVGLSTVGGALGVRVAKSEE